MCCRRKQASAWDRYIFYGLLEFESTILDLTFMVKILFLGNFPEYDVSLY